MNMKINPLMIGAKIFEYFIIQTINPKNNTVNMIAINIDIILTFI